MNNLNVKLNSIQNLIDCNKSEEACVEFFRFIRESEETNDENLPFLYYKFAFILFDNEFYEDCIMMLNNAYKSNYMKKEIKEFIFDSFIIPNLNSFEESYFNNFNNYNSHLNSKISALNYNELKLEFIPVSSDKYYIFDLEKDTFDETIDFSTENINIKPHIHFEDEFSDILLIDNYNLNNLINYIQFTPNRKIYYLTSSPLKTLSFFKLPNIVDSFLNNIIIFDTIYSLEDYFQNNPSVYLPKIILNLDPIACTNTFNIVNDIINNTHKSRLSSKHRDDSNILLSVCIPSYNRGHRALKNILSLMKLNYDSEIEFVVSNNGSDVNIDGYNKIKTMDDSRITYFEFKSNQGYLKNVCNVLNLAKGKFALLISDEDMVNFSALSHYMSILQNNSNLGVIRSGSTKNYKNLNIVHKKAGIDAFKNFFLSNNYASGTIYNTRILNDNKFTELIEKRSHEDVSCLYYAHMWLDALVTFKGDFYQDSAILCIEGIGEDDTVPDHLKSLDSSIYAELPPYQPYENRIEQHYGFIELLNMLPLSLNEDIIDAYLSLCWKTNFLVSLVKHKYIKYNFNIDKIFDELYQCCINGIFKLNITIDDDMVYRMKFVIKKYNEDYR